MPTIRGRNSSSNIISAKSRQRSRSKSEKRLSVANREKASKTTNASVSVSQSGQDIAGQGMTIWWLVLSMITLFFRFEQQGRAWILSLPSLPDPAIKVVWDYIYTTSPNSMTSVVRLMQGVSTVSALCVMIGYYTFKICFRYVQGSMAWQLYTKTPSLMRFIPFWCFYVLDILVHVVFASLITYFWWQYVDSLAAVVAWVYHRLWSFVHSKGATVFFTRVEEVYGFKEPMPYWAYLCMYLSEALIIAFALYSASNRFAAPK